MSGRRVRKEVRERQRVVVKLEGMWALREQYLEWLLSRNFSSETLRGVGSDVRRFLKWCDERSLVEPTDVTQPVVERYQRWLYYHRREDGKPLSFRSQHHLLCSVKSFFKWTTRQHLTLFNPAAEIELPRIGVRLPRDVLTVDEAEALLAQPDVDTPLGLRDRTILEVLYSTGIRRRELANLALYDLDTIRGTLMIREGKGRRDRVVPIGKRARDWIERYVLEVRPDLVVAPDAGHMFLTVEGNSFRRLSNLSEMVRKYLKRTPTHKRGGCHIFRHTMATLMLENGADTRIIQEILGHSRLSTTEVYTHVSIRMLQEIHKATHPAERPPRPTVDSEPSVIADKALTHDRHKDPPTN